MKIMATYSKWSTLLVRGTLQMCLYITLKDECREVIPVEDLRFPQHQFCGLRSSVTLPLSVTTQKTRILSISVNLHVSLEARDSSTRWLSLFTCSEWFHLPRFGPSLCFPDTEPLQFKGVYTWKFENGIFFRRHHLCYHLLLITIK